jgi:hypothetical protein
MKDILFVRYAPGSAGNFLISLLQISNRVACWNTSVEEYKNTNKFEKEYFNWFTNCFNSNLSEHLKSEPHHPYNLDFFSSKHNRGNNINDFDFIEMLKKTNNHIFLHNIEQKKFTVMRLNKTVVPEFGKNAVVVNILIDTPSYKWLHRARQVKLFRHLNGQTTSKENHPEYLVAKRKKNNFNNPYDFCESYFSFAKHRVIGEPVVKIFKDKTKLIDNSSNLQCQQHFIFLSELLDETKICSIMQQLFDILNLGTPNLDLIAKCFEHYKKTNIDPII